MARKMCEICGRRAAGTGKIETDDRATAISFGYCGPCLDECNYENSHSDHGHDDPEAVAKGYAEQAELDQCWMCHPELNAAQADHTPRTGHTNTRAHTWSSHAEHHHGRTPADRAKCRASMKATGKPYDQRKKK